MKAYKCPECGYLNEIFEPYSASLRKCPECGFSFVKNVVREKVELIDWEQEMLLDK